MLFPNLGADGYMTARECDDGCGALFGKRGRTVFWPLMGQPLGMNVRLNRVLLSYVTRS